VERPADTAERHGSTSGVSPGAVRGAVVAVALGALLVALGTARASAPQSRGPRALDATHALTYFIAAGSERTGFRPSDRQLALWALDAWRRSAANTLRFEPAAESDAIVRLYWAERSEGQFGEMQPFVVGGRPGAAVFIRPDMESFGPDIARRARGDSLFRDSIVYLTCLHELGHALGLIHTRDFRDVMYFFGYGGDIGEFFGRYRVQIHARDDIATVSGLSAGDVSQLKARYGLK
jgi:hypothetical protein